MLIPLSLLIYPPFIYVWATLKLTLSLCFVDWHIQFTCLLWNQNLALLHQSLRQSHLIKKTEILPWLLYKALQFA